MVSLKFKIQKASEMKWKKKNGIEIKYKLNMSTRCFVNMMTN